VRQLLPVVPQLPSQAYRTHQFIRRELALSAFRWHFDRVNPEDQGTRTGLISQSFKIFSTIFLGHSPLLSTGKPCEWLMVRVCIYTRSPGDPAPLNGLRATQKCSPSELHPTGPLMYIHR
jgi:hypothetical protein